MDDRAFWSRASILFAVAIVMALAAPHLGRALEAEGGIVDVLRTIDQPQAHEGFWTVVERASWLFGIAGLAAALWFGLSELRRIGNELSRRPELSTGLLLRPVGSAGAELGGRVRRHPEQHDLVTGAGVVFVTVLTTNRGQRSAKGVLLNYLARDPVRLMGPNTTVERTADGWFAKRWEMAIHPGASVQTRLALLVPPDVVEVPIRVNIGYEDASSQSVLLAVDIDH